MISVKNYDVNSLAKSVAKFWEKGAMAPIFYDSYLRKSNRETVHEARTIRIPKSLNHLLSGDFEAQYEFIFQPPNEINGIQFWGETSAKGVYVDAGYENGDSRFPCDVQLSDSIVHGLLGGATGMGKSVFLDSVLYGILTRYPPWEVTLTLLDSKIVTFKPLANSGLPHIQNIAATSDNDYLLSVLESKVEEMNLMNQVFEKSLTGAQKLEDLRERTGLCFPRNIIIFDEFQACLSQAGRNASKITKMLDLFGRLGRSTGYHLLLSSQEVGSALPKGLLNQIKLRMRLGCSANVSEVILGNDEARTIKTKGKMLMNTEPTEANNSCYNREFRVPFLESRKMKPELQGNIISIASQYPYKNDLNFYNETQVVRESKFGSYVRAFPRDPKTFYLGEPCRYTTGKLKITSITLEDRSLDNIVIISPVEIGRVRFVRMLAENLRMTPDYEQLVFYNDERSFKATNLSNLTDKIFMIRDASDEYYRSAIENIFYRSLLCDVDSKTFVSNMTDDASDELYRAVISRSPNLASETNRARCFYLNKFLRTDTYMNAFGYKGARGNDLENSVRNSSWLALTYAARYGFKDKQVVRTKLPKRFVWLLDIDKINGIGRDTKSIHQDFLKKACQDGPIFGVHLIICTGTLTDMTFLKECSTYVLMESPRSRDVTFIGAGDVYPNEVSGVLAVLFNREADECFKFKKMFFDDEILVT